METTIKQGGAQVAKAALALLLALTSCVGALTLDTISVDDFDPEELRSAGYAALARQARDGSDDARAVA